MNLPSLPNVGGVINIGKSLLKANRPEILLGTSVVTTIASSIMAGIGGYRSGKQVKEAEMSVKLQDDGTPIITYDPLSKLEVASMTWKNYAPAGGLALGAVASTVGLHAVHVQEKKALIATALAAVEEVRTAAKEYIDDLNTSVDDNATAKSREKIYQAAMEKSADRNGGSARVLNSDGVIREVYMCRDAKTGRDIWSNQLEIEEALLELNKELHNDGEASLGAFYSHAGFEPLEDGEEVGWNGGEKVELYWDVQRKGDGRPVCVFSFNPAPHSGYDKSR